MAADDVGKVLGAFADHGVRQQVASGDFSSFVNLNLSDEEQGMLREAASDLPEPESFGLDSYREMGCGPIEEDTGFGRAAVYAYGPNILKAGNCMPP